MGLRAYQVGDLPRLHALDRACFPPRIAYGKAQLRALLEHPSALSAIAYQRARVVGFIILRPRLRRSRGVAITLLHLLTIDVAPEARRAGVGSLLMHWALDEVKRVSARGLELEVAVDNAAAQAFYARFGFKVTGTISGYYPDGLDAISMERLGPQLIEPAS